MDQQPQSYQPFPNQQPPQQTPPPTAPETPKPKKSHKKIWMSIGSVLVVLGVAIGVVFLIGALSSQTDSEPEDTTPDSPAVALVTGLRDDLGETIVPTTGVEVYEAGQQLGPGFMRPTLLAADESYAVFPVEAYGLSATVTPQQEEATVAALTGSLETAGLTETDKVMNGPNETDAYRLANTEFSCTVSSTPLLTAESADVQSVRITVACAELSAFSTNETTIAPFALAYEPIPEITGKPLFEVAINAPTDAGSQTAFVDTRSYPFGLFGTASYYFRASESAEWQYLTSSQAEPSCAAFSDTAVRAAYATTICAEEDGTLRSIGE